MLAVEKDHLAIGEQVVQHHPSTFEEAKNSPNGEGGGGQSQATQS